MKKKLLYGLLGAAGCIGLAGSMVSCSDTFDPSADSEGSFLVDVALNKDVIASEGNRRAPSPTRADGAAIAASDLSLRITHENGSFVRVWDTLADFTEPVSVPVGKYDIEAFYGSAETEGFDKPYYYGTSTMTVMENRTTPVSVTAQLANTMVRFEMSDMFRTYFKSYSLSVRSELGNEIEYADGETRSVYLKPGQVTTTITVTKQNGTTATLEPKSFTAQPRHSYVLSFDVNGGEAGDGELVLTYDDLCQTEDVIIDLSDAILNAPAPRLTLEGCTDGDTWSVIYGEPSAYSPKVTMYAQAGIDGVILTANSQYLQSKGVPAEVDLASADDATLSLLRSMGLRFIGCKKGEKMAMIDFADLLKNIEVIDGNNLSTFSVQVRDANQRVAENPVGFSVEAVNTSLAIVKMYPLFEYATLFEFEVEYNGSDLSGLKLLTKNDRNTWDDCEILSCVPIEGEEGKFTVSANVPSTVDDLQMRIQLGSLRADFTVKHVSSPYTLTTAENGVYGWQAVVDVNHTGSSAAKRRTGRSAENPEVVSFELSTDNGRNWTATTSAKVSDNRYVVKGMSAGQTYQLRGNCDGTYTKMISVTTTSGPQLYNASLEEWTRTDGATANWWIDYITGNATTSWGTMNELTTSEGGNSALGTGNNRNGCSYNAYSGTQPTTDSHSGNAAYIATVGWGKGNTAAMISGRMGTCNHLTPGELFLGSYNADSKTGNYGIPFAYSPKSVTFWYKYTAKNSADYGYAEIRVLDASGNVIASKSKNLTAAESYTEETLDIKDLYDQHLCVRPATLDLRFNSSANADCHSINVNNLTPPPAMNLNNGRYTGSELYIDDITLNY